MGLKTRNYQVKGTGEIYESVYAVLSNLSIEGDQAEATFHIHRDREKCFKFTPLETKRILFTVDREENPYTTAYKKAKEKIIKKVFNHELKQLETIEKDGIFTGWEDDYL